MDSRLRPSRVPPPRPSGSTVPSLTQLAIQYISHNLDCVGGLGKLPEEIVQQLLYLILMRSELNPHTVRLFAGSGHESVVRWIRENLDVTAALLPAPGHCKPDH